MFPGLDPKKMQAVMKQMGIAQQEIDASRVIIEKQEGGRIIIEPANVTKIKMQGQESFQITGDVREEAESVEISDSDIKTVMEKTGVSKQKAKEALEETDDLAEAILKLS